MKAAAFAARVPVCTRRVPPLKLNRLAVAVLASKSRTIPPTMRPPESRLTVPVPPAPPIARPMLAVPTLVIKSCPVPETLMTPTPFSPETILVLMVFVKVPLLRFNNPKPPVAKRPTDGVPPVVETVPPVWLNTPIPDAPIWKFRPVWNDPAERL